MQAEELFDVESGENLPEVPEDKGHLKPIAETTPRERAAGIVAAAAIGTSVAAIIVEQSAIVFVAGIFSAIIGPYAYWQQTRLTDIAALKETHEAVALEVDRLSAENERLSDNIQELSTSVDRLEEIDDALQAISKTQGQNVGEFEKQVEQNREILSKVKTNHKTSVLQNLLSVILRCDTDGDFKMGQAEIESVMHRMEHITGITVHEDRFRAAIEGRTINAIMDIISNLLKENIPKDQRIFNIKEES